MKTTRKRGRHSSADKNENSCIDGDAAVEIINLDESDTESTGNDNDQIETLPTIDPTSSKQEKHTKGKKQNKKKELQISSPPKKVNVFCFFFC